jgi:hypothetical protein
MISEFERVMITILDYTTMNTNMLPGPNKTSGYQFSLRRGGFKRMMSTINPASRIRRVAPCSGLRSGNGRIFGQRD